MDAQATAPLLHGFRSIVDPRAANVRHLLNDILSIVILAVLCGAEGWEMVEAWGCGNLKWLATFLELPHGIPSHDTFDRVFALLDPLAFERCFMDWTAALVQGSRGLLVAVDGKTLRRSWKHAWSKTPVHLVSTFATQNQLVLEPSGHRRQEQRDHRHPSIAGDAGPGRGNGDDRCHGVPA